MSLKIYNTLHRKKEVFAPKDKGIVKMYVCGPTVYNYISIGNTRPVVVFDMVRNYLEYIGYKVNYVQNITDIEDKIINKAREENVGFEVITKRYIKAFLDDIKKIEVGKFSEMPRASEMIEEIIQIINKIIENGYGYVVDNNVYFDVHKFRDYGKLSRQKIDEMRQQEGDSFKKKSEIDFALWKSAKEEEPSWESPWGMGRPGWHIECSAMSIKFLGYGFDIHGGGIDLVFPHHENEIAQSEAAFPGKGDFARFWMHNGMIEVKEEKMSKSKGLKDDWILRNLLKKYSPNVIKRYILSTHYRNPLEFSIDKLIEAKKALERVNNTLRNIKFLIEGFKLEQFIEEKPIDGRDNGSSESELKIYNLIKRCKEGFRKSMDDDFNSAKALGIIFDFVKKVNSIIQAAEFKLDESLKESLDIVYKKIIQLGMILGIDFEGELSKSIGRHKKVVNLDDEEIENLIKLREKLRKKKNYKKADDIRSKLEEYGIVLDDRKEGTIWRLKEKKNE